MKEIYLPTLIFKMLFLIDGYKVNTIDSILTLSSTTTMTLLLQVTLQRDGLIVISILMLASHVIALHIHILHISGTSSTLEVPKLSLSL